MTDEQGRGAGSTGRQPWSVDLLADLHAGALDEATAARLRPQAEADPEARAVLDALESTRGSVRELGEVPQARMPDDVAARLAATIEDEHVAREGSTSKETGLAGSAQTGEVVSLTAARRKRNRRLGWASGAVAAAAAVAAIVTVGVTNLGGNTEQGRPVAEAPSSGGGALALHRDQLGNKGFSAALGARDYGPLEHGDRLADCIAANHAGDPSSVAGVKQLRLDGKPGVLILLTTGKSAQYRLLVVGPECAQGHPATMSNSLIGKSGSPPTS